MTSSLHVICYDTPDDRVRRKLVSLLSRRGRRVQYSVFEVLLDAGSLRRLIVRLEGVLGPEDNVLIYGVTGVRVSLGHAPPALDEQPRSQVI